MSNLFINHDRKIIQVIICLVSISINICLNTLKNPMRSSKEVNYSTANKLHNVIVTLLVQVMIQLCEYNRDSLL